VELVAVLQGSSSSRGSKKDVIEMNVINYNPSTHSWASNVYETWKKYVEERQMGVIKSTFITVVH
jgi:hypothetical protein